MKQVFGFIVLGILLLVQWKLTLLLAALLGVIVGSTLFFEWAFD